MTSPTSLAAQIQALRDEIAGYRAEVEALDHRVAKNDAAVLEIRAEMARQHEAWTVWREAEARSEQPAPVRRSRPARRHHTGTRHLEAVPGGAA
jgi:hypothetical protein